jgi:hypothetical protein
LKKRSKPFSKQTIELSGAILISSNPIKLVVEIR